jgi:oxygen-independent coproporphyrinogen-3 oxidase
MTIPITFDAELLRRYDGPSPRYTSYPTAVSFDSSFGQQQLEEYIRRSSSAPTVRQLSLYVHVPYCFSPCFYCGCNRIITRDVAKGAAYLSLLTCEIDALGALFDRNREVVQLHLGGGTPNFLQPAELAQLMACLEQNFRFGPPSRRDISIELDPRFLARGDVATYAQLGFNRASLGVQDFDPAVQLAVNRVQSVEQTLDVLVECRTHGFRSINIDLIYGLPKQTAAGFERTLDSVLGARPERLAIYSYAHLPTMFKAQRQIVGADLPSAADKLGLLQLAIDKLTAAGYAYIGMDHFALPEDELCRAQSAGTLQRNFMGYTTHAHCDLVGMGMSAISHIGDSFSQNPRELQGWRRALEAGRLPVWRGRTLDSDDVLRADVIQQLMCQGRIDIATVERRYAIEFATYFAASIERLQRLIGDGLVHMDACEISATARGRLLLRVIAMCFDRYLEQPQQSAAGRFSRAI